MSIRSDHPLLQRIVDDLADVGWSHQRIFLPDDLTHELAQECRRRSDNGLLAPAAIGRGEAQVIREGVRGDHIAWLEGDETEPALTRYLDLMDALRLAFNQGLFLGLEDYESHFALYPPGAFYATHVDRFRDDDRRVISLVLYLNDVWLPEHGGALRLHLPNGEKRDVLPTGGSLVCFMSGEMPHEVLPATRERMSLTGWFRRRGENVLENVL
ncbi:SM-20-related protein [Pseudomonas duriflava]|uniref:SM-20-related protein n=1 Tax=Pseudomonas duriflava TaxID=459528 RepID=A0A562Q6B5_9PSED|nr:2OG-Fe(II) oxygenase [Pseudomonas duriflava]TWI52287.1 SM-20-related protein [Pseudomonas duriflava]